MPAIIRKLLRRPLSKTASRLEGCELSVGAWPFSALSSWATRRPLGRVCLKTDGMTGQQRDKTEPPSGS